MEFLSDEYINYVRSHYSILIGWLTALIGGPVGVYIFAKLTAIMHRGNPSNKIIDLISNKIGDERKQG